SVHQRELEATNLRHQRDTLVQRLRDDYQIEMSELFGRARQGEAPAEPVAETPGAATPFDPAAAQEEIEELRRKLSRLGNVNMEALQELNELDTRAVSLKTQFD